MKGVACNQQSAEVILSAPENCKDFGVLGTPQGMSVDKLKAGCSIYVSVFCLVFFLSFTINIVESSKIRLS